MPTGWGESAGDRWWEGGRPGFGRCGRDEGAAGRAAGEVLLMAVVGPVDAARKGWVPQGHPIPHLRGGGRGCMPLEEAGVQRRLSRSNAKKDGYGFRNEGHGRPGQMQSASLSRSTGGWPPRMAKPCLQWGVGSPKGGGRLGRDNQWSPEPEPSPPGRWPASLLPAASVSAPGNC